MVAPTLWRGWNAYSWTRTAHLCICMVNGAWGKLRLLLNLDHYLPSSIISVFFDGQGVSGYLESTDLYLYFINEIRLQAQKQRAIDLPPLILRENGAGNFAQISAWVDRAEAILADNGCFHFVHGG